MRKYLFLILIFTLNFAYADEDVIAEFSDETLPILNENLRKLDVEEQIKEKDKLDMHERKAVNLAHPTASADAATKAYVDNIIQIVNIQTGAMSTGSTVIPFDNTIPQNNEGNEYMALSITPKSATNILKIDVIVNGAVNIADRVAAALFQDSIANALAATMSIGGINYDQNLKITYVMTAGTTSAITFKVRAGPVSAGTFTFNGNSGNAYFGGVLLSSITITECIP